MRNLKGRGLSVYSEPNGYHIRHPTSTLNVVAPAGVWQSDRVLVPCHSVVPCPGLRLARRAPS